MKVASRSGFLVFLGGIFAARNVAHVRAAFTLPPPRSDSLNDFLRIMSNEVLPLQLDSSALIPYTPLLELADLKLIRLG
jgi:hypothetical protein